MSTTELDRDGYAIVADVLTLSERDMVRASAQRLLDSTITRGRDRGADGKDGFRGCVGLDPGTFLPLISKPTVLRAVIDALGPNVHVLSTHLIALPSIPEGATRSIRTPERPGWHRDMYGVATDLGQQNTPRLAVKCAFYLTPITSDCGITQVVPGSHTLTEPPSIAGEGVDPAGAITPDIGPCDGMLFENRTWHAGGLNSSGCPRLAVMVQYGYRWLAPVDDPVPELLTDSEITEVQRQLLGAPDRAPDGALAKGRGAEPLRRWHAHHHDTAVA